MKRRKQMITLVSVLALLIVGIVAVRFLNPAGEQEDSVISVFSVNASEVTALSWTNETGEVSFVRQNGSWKYREDSAFPLDNSVMALMLEQVCHIEADRTIKEPQALAEYGLAQPTCTIRIEAAGKTTELFLGIQNGDNKLHYLSNGDGNVYLVDSSLYNHFARGLCDLVVKEQIPDLTLAFSLLLENGKRSLDMQWSQDKWLLKDTQIVLKEDAVAKLLSTFSQMTWNKCVAYNADGAELEQYGLDVPGAVVVAKYMQDSQEQTFRLEFSGIMDGKCYARIGGSGMIYLVDDGILNAANTEQEALLAN